MSETMSAAVARAAARTALTYGARVAEVISRPRVRTITDVPVCTDAITAQWLTAILCRDHPGVQVLSFTTDGASSQTTSRASLRLTYSDGAPDDLPRDLFVKLMESGRQRLLAGLIRIIDGEAEFYDRLRPLADFECPRGYYGRVDKRSWACAVVVENIAVTRGATFCHATTNIDRPAIESLLHTMASFHGQYWEHPAVVHSTLKRPVDHLHNIGLFLNAKKQSRVGVERTPGFPEALRARHDELWDCLGASMRELSHGCPVTLLHGDPHVGNTYRTGDGRMAFTDWQVVMRGGWAYDFAGAIASSLTIEDRRAWERDLLAFYLDALARAGGVAPRFDKAFDLYRRSLMYPLFCWTTVLGAPAWMPDTQPADVAMLINERIGTAIDDLDALGAF